MLALLCSGQGAQHAGMFALTGAAPEAQALFASAQSLLGYDPRAPHLASATLHRNRDAQIVCTLAALSIACVAGARLPQRRCVAGYSVGEIAAWSLAGLIDPLTALSCVDARARAMDAASNGDEGMLFVRGLSRDAIDAMCRQRDAAVAIVNPGDAFVLAGRREALEAIAADASRHASRVVPVAVNVASHTRFLAAATPAFRAQLARIRVAPIPSAGVRLISAVDASTVLDVALGLDKLAAQLSQPVLWAASMDACVEAGASAFLELGPGRALAEMAAAAYPSLPARSVDDFKSMQGLSDWLSRWRE